MRKLTIGDVTITSIIERDGPWRAPEQMFPKAAAAPDLLAERLKEVEPETYDPATGKMVITYQTYVVRTPHHNILVDSCVGNHQPRPTRPGWDRMQSDRWERGLAATGLTVNDIDYVMCTHLHVDHIGWNTRLDNGRWVPTFPKARYLFADRELAFWMQKHKDEPDNWPWIGDSVLPILEAKRADVVKSDHAVNDFIQLIPTPGHTIDHYSVHVGKTGADAVITGDMIHSPIQARYPELGMRADYDSKLAGQSRRKVFSRFCDTSTLLFTAHFPSPSTGRVVRWRDAFDFAPI